MPLYRYRLCRRRARQVGNKRTERRIGRVLRGTNWWYPARSCHWGHSIDGSLSSSVWFGHFLPPSALPESVLTRHRTRRGTCCSSPHTSAHSSSTHRYGGSHPPRDRGS